MSYKVFVFSLPLITSVVLAEPLVNAQVVDHGNLYLAETETHSTAGIGNKAPPQYNRDYLQQLPPDEMYPYYEEGLVNEELTPPTSAEQMSPTKSKTITRTTSRPSSNNPQPAGVDVAPVIVPVYPNTQGNPPPPGVYVPPPVNPRYP